MPRRTRLETFLAGVPSILVGYSGGVDSTLLAVTARQVLGKGRAVAALGVSASLAAAQRRQAVDLARRFDLDLVEIATDELQDPDYVTNAPSRCFFCKRELWAKLGALARARGLALVADGTNADDLGEHRPGLAAAAAARVRAPLAELGYTKARVRAEARAAGIPIWDAPAAPCLASRVRYGLAVTPERLRAVEQGEALLRGFGVGGDLRVRHRGEEARIEVAPAEFATVRRHRDRLSAAFLELGFDRVTLDLAGYRRGSQLAPRAPALEVLAERA